MSTHNVRDDQLPRGAGTGPADAAITPSASVILLRGQPFEVLLMRRAEKSSFVPGAWVFPGGIVEAEDRGADEQATARACAVRELAEEAGVRLPGISGLVWTARWITPVGVPKRFDTWFFLAELPAGQTPAVDDREGVELRWFTPVAALEGHRRGELAMVFPTIKTLESLLPWPSIPALFAARQGATIPTTRPVIVTENGQKKVVLPD
ncbi:MAG: NUDIX hydrolase [Planctomycetes bacterium]|nr:NUDIX hydrolase [Planctomycetota bacterium]